MTEQDFITKLIDIGYDEEEVKSLIEIINKMKTYLQDITYEELIEHAIKAFEKTKDWPKDGIFVD
jgi:Holliday junction resolvasome RuvABC DNA-binding subunit